jgi:hypothetical protein
MLPNGRFDLEFTTVNFLIADFSDGRLSALDVWRTTTN